LKKLKAIPRPRETSYTDKKIPVRDDPRNSKLLFSFELLDFSNAYYNCNGMCDKGIKNCFEKLRDYSKFTINELYSNKGNSSLRFHLINKEEVDDWPECLKQNKQLEDSFFQISFGKSRGRVHGVLIDNVFYVIWLDPQHFLYHDKKFGSKRPFTNLENCCSIRESIINEQYARIVDLKKENEELLQLLDERTTPDET